MDVFLRRFFYFLILVGVGGFLIHYFNKPTPVIQPLIPITQPVKPIYTPVASSELTTLVNQERVGLTPLTETSELDLAAQKKCNDMERRDYWAHSINGETFYQFDPPAQMYGENLAEGFQTGREVVAAWMASPEHKANIMNPLYTTVGFDSCNGPIKNLVVQELELP